MDLDKHDYRLLQTLDLDARQPISQLSEVIELGRETTRYRLHRLVEQDIIEEFVTILNAPSLGMTTFRIHFTFNSLNTELVKAIKQSLLKSCYWLVRVRGNWHFNTLFQTTQPSNLQEFLEHFTYEYGERMEDYRVDIITKIHHFRRNLTKSTEKQPVRTWGSQEHTINLDNTDQAILEAIQTNARTSAVDLADACNTTPRVVRYRLRQYEENNVILGYKPTLNIQKLGYSYVKVELDLQQQTEAIIDKLYDYIREQPLILVYVTEAIGGPDFEFELYIEDTDELYSLIDDLYSTFTCIKNWNWMEYTNQAKLSYLQRV